MCFKYEGEYQVCFDAMLIGDEDDSLILFLEREYNVQVTDTGKFAQELFAFFEQLHLKGLIKPVEE